MILAADPPPLASPEMGEAAAGPDAHSSPEMGEAGVGQGLHYQHQLTEVAELVPHSNAYPTPPTRS